MTAPVSGEMLPPVCILAGGLGTRLGSRTETLPKPLIEVAGKPFIFHQLELLRRHGAGRVVLCVGYLGELVEAKVGDGRDFGVEVVYSYDGPQVIGTAAAVRRAATLLDDEFLILYGDTYLRIDYRELVRTRRRCGKPALMAVLRNRGRWGESNASFDGKLVRYRKDAKDPSFEWIDYGVSVVTQGALALAPKEDSDLAAVFSWLAARELLAGFEASERFYEIGTPQALEEAEVFLSLLRDQAGHG